MKNEKISVIIPIWKPIIEQLKQCLDSIINQTYENLEILIIYKKSDDFDRDFFHLIDEYHDENRLRVVKSKSKDFVNALNEGIINASGKLIGRIDGDDYCDAKRFETQVEFKNENNLNIISTWAYQISHDGKILGKIQVPVTHEEIRRKMMLHSPMLHSFILMDRKMLDKIGFYDTSFIHAEDYELFFRAMYYKYRFGNVPHYLGYARESLDSRSRGSEWKTQRLYYMKAKTKAFREYGFTKPYDLFYYSFTPLAYFMSPRLWEKTKKFTGWVSS